MNSLAQAIKRLDTRISRYFNVAPTSRETRRRAEFYLRWLDHGFLRTVWTNMEEISPGVFRSNHPGPGRMKALRARGIKTILNLRGATKDAPYLLEREAADALGMDMINLSMSARTAPKRETLLRLIEVFRTIERPFVMHCKSGADRAGLASAVYLIVMDGVSPQEAARMLSLRYVHIKRFRTGVLDAFLEAYRVAHSRTGIPLETWITEVYDAEDLQRAFDATRRPN